MSGHLPVGVLAVGYGYWGPNIVRNLSERPEFRLTGLCERSERRIDEFRRRYPAVWVEHEFELALEDPRVEAVSIATPPGTHYPLVRQALEAGKHVLVEKPLATTAAHAADLVELARERGLVLMPGHTFVYSPAVEKVRELIHDDVLGEIYFVTSSRMNLGNYQRDGVMLDLAPHDLSILSHWLDEPLVQVTAQGRSVFQKDIPETAFLTLEFEGGTQASVQISWLAPRKVRQMVVVGSQKMVHYEDSSSDESVRVYDRGLDFDEPPSSFGEYQLTYRTGDMVAPRIDASEPLGLELQDFAKAIREGTEPRSGPRLGLQIVLALEALQQSLRNRGEPVSVPSVEEFMATGSDVIPISNGNGASPLAATWPDARGGERRCSERRSGERRGLELGPPAGEERRVADRRAEDRRTADRRDGSGSLGARFVRTAAAADANGGASAAG